MSRIGKAPVKIPAGVEVSVNNTNLTVKGPKGSLALNFDKHIKVEVKDGSVIVARPNDAITMKSLHGTTRALINDMVVGVTTGFKKELEVKGVGYRCEMKGNDLVLHVGHSHADIITPPAEVKISTKGLIITVEGIAAQKVGQVAADIRLVRKPEPYHGKGIRYTSEMIALRAPSAKKKGAAAGTPAK